MRECKEANHIDEHLTINQIRQCKRKSNEQVASLFKIYEAVNPPSELIKKDYVAMKDNLIINISFRIDPRDGVLSNLCYKELDKAKLQGEFYLVDVETHKGAGNFGPATVSFKKESTDKMRTLAYKLRPMSNIKGE